MKPKRIFSLLLGSGVALVTIGVSSAEAALIVNTTNDATVLANTILGSGITASNFSYTGAANASGTFTGGLSAGLGIDSGIILTSGDANLAPGPNNSSGAGSSNGAAGDSTLAALAAGSSSNASVLTFNFNSNSSDLFFNFTFGSEEYNEYVGSSFNDVFGFFVDGVNIALLPGTTTPVSINNVNLGSNAASFINNTGGVYNNNLQYDGLTTVLQAKSLGLAPGDHTIKIAISDIGDSILDSGVFLQAGTFSSTPIPPGGTGVPEPFTIVGTLIGGTAALRMRKKLSSANKA